MTITQKNAHYAQQRRKKCSIFAASFFILLVSSLYPPCILLTKTINYKSSSGATPITTLLKKDGTGKIGIFKISDTQVVIDVPSQGKVVIDGSTDNQGIYIQTTAGVNKAVIVPRAISNYQPKPDTTKDLSYGGSGGVALTQGTEKILTTFTTSAGGTSKLTIEGVLDTAVSFSYAGGGTSTATETLYLRAYNSSTQTTIVSGSITQNVPTGGASANINVTGSSKTLTLNASTTYYLCVIYTNSRGSSSATDYTLFDATLTFRPNFVPITAIGTDGILSVLNTDTYFMVVNNGTSNQKVFMKGLPTSTTGLMKGQIYNSSGTLKIY